MHIESYLLHVEYDRSDEQEQIWHHVCHQLTHETFDALHARMCREFCAQFDLIVEQHHREHVRDHTK
jgi:hypothetical protein